MDKLPRRIQTLMDKPALKRAFSKPLHEAGFVGKGQTWFLEGEDSIAVVNLQKSDYADYYYVNLAWWLKALGEERYPKEHSCHLRTRATSLWPDRASEIDTLFDLTESRYEDDDWGRRISSFVRESIVPFSRSLLTLEGIRTMRLTGNLSKKILIRRVAESLIGDETVPGVRQAKPGEGG